MALRPDELRRYLLGLIGQEARPALHPDLDHDDWLGLSAMAAQHRIRPYLYAQIQRSGADIYRRCGRAMTTAGPD